MFIFVISCITVVLFLIIFKHYYLCGGRNTLTHSLKGKFIIITGASSGIGKYSAHHLIENGATVMFACRNKQRALSAMKGIKHPSQALYTYIDLCDYSSIIAFAKEIKQNHPKIDILMNNAGAHPRDFTLTKDKYESFVQGNYLGMVLLSYLLLDHMNARSKIINVSSLGHVMNDITKERLKLFEAPQLLEKEYFTSLTRKLLLYCDTKLFVVQFTRYFAKECEQHGKQVKMVCLHPGVVDTAFVRFVEDYKVLALMFKLVTPIWKYLSKTTEQGAQTQLLLSYMPYEDIMNGCYYSDCTVKKPHDKALDDELVKYVMNWTIGELKGKVRDEEVMRCINNI